MKKIARYMFESLTYVGKCKAIIIEYEILILYYWNKNKDESVDE